MRRVANVAGARYGLFREAATCLRVGARAGTLPSRGRVCGADGCTRAAVPARTGRPDKPRARTENPADSAAELCAVKQPHGGEAGEG